MFGRDLSSQEYYLFIMVACFVCALGFVHSSFLQKLKPENPGRILWTAPRMYTLYVYLY